MEQALEQVESRRDIRRGLIVGLLAFVLAFVIGAHIKSRVPETLAWIIVAFYSLLAAGVGGLIGWWLWPGSKGEEAVVDDEEE